MNVQQRMTAVPEPRNGSRTRSPLDVQSLMASTINRNRFWSGMESKEVSFRNLSEEKVFASG